MGKKTALCRLDLSFQVLECFYFVLEIKKLWRNQLKSQPKGFAIQRKRFKFLSPLSSLPQRPKIPGKMSWICLLGVLFCGALSMKAYAFDSYAFDTSSRPSVSLEPAPEQVLSAHPSIWTIEYGRSGSKGTAFAVGPNTVVTNFHVIFPILLRSGGDITNNIFLHKGDGAPPLALKRLISISPRGDLALLEIEGRVSEWLNIEQTPPSPEEPLYVLNGESHILSTGDTRCEEDYYCFFPSNVFIKKGTSGSPVLSAQGGAAGVVFMSSSNILYMSKWDILKDFIAGGEGLFCNDLSAMDCIDLSLKDPFYNENHWGQYLVSEIMQTRGDWFAHSGDPTSAKMFYEKAFHFLSISAEAGFSLAQNVLASAYKEGKLAPKSAQMNVYWNRRAAQQGLSSSQLNFASALYKGVGVGQNKEEAILWYHRAALQGLALAQFQLGALLHAGSGVGQDIDSALYWYREAALQGHERAQMALMDMYYVGMEGIEQDREESFQWALLAARQGHQSAQYNVGFMYEEDKNFIEAVYWYREAAGQGHTGAQYALMLLYYWGQGVLEDRKEAFRWAVLAARQGMVPAQHILGLMYEEAEGVDQDLIQALHWYGQAAGQGFPASQYRLALMLEEGRGIDKNLPLAKVYYEKAALQGHPQAQSRLYFLEEEGI